MDEFSTYPKKNHIKLEIFSSEQHIEYNYKIIAEIIIENDFIVGDLVYDERAKRYLLENMNNIGADALIINNACSDLVQTCFYAIHYTDEPVYLQSYEFLD